MRFLILVTVVLFGCASEPSPAVGTWNLTMTPNFGLSDCIAQGVVADERVTASFEVIDTDVGLIVDSGPSEPGVVEVYYITELDDGALITVETYQQGVMEGDASLRSDGRSVTGTASLLIYDPACEQDYKVTGRIDQDE